MFTSHSKIKANAAQWTKGVPMLYVATGATLMKASILNIITSIQFITYKVFPQ